MLSIATKCLAAVAALALTLSAAQAETVTFGASAPKSGPLAGGAATTHWPNIQLWVHDVNEAGGLRVGDQRMTVEVIEYDDRTSPEDAVRNIQRLVTQDEVDFLIAPYATGFNIATAPIIARYGYPHIVATAPTDAVAQFAKRWPNSVWIAQTASQMAEGAVQALVHLRDAGEIGDGVALVHVTDAFGLEMAGATKPRLEEAVFEIVYETSYPLGTQDMAPIVSGAIAAAPDAFVAFRYPGDTFALTEQARIQKPDVGAFYTGVGTAFPGFRDRFGAEAEGIMGVGGVDMSSQRMQDYFARHEEVTGIEPDYGASAYTYAGLEMLGQAIEAAGTLDRAAVVAELQTGTFDTVVGEMKMVDNNNPRTWTPGQWVDGVFRVVSASGMQPGAEPVRKDPWQ